MRRHDDDGASAVEYGLLVAAIAGMIVSIVFGLSVIVRETYSTTCAVIASGTGTAGCDAPTDDTTTP